MTPTPLRPRTLAIGGLIALAAAMGIGRFIFTPILPSMVEALGISRGQAGLIAGANFAGYLAGALAAASPALSSQLRRWLVAMLIVSAATTAAMGLVSGLAEFLVLRFIGGFASAVVLVMASTLILERLNAAGRGDLSAWHFSGVGCGITVSALLIEALQYQHLDWHWMWFAGGIVSLAAVVAVFALVPDQTDSSRTATPAAAIPTSPHLPKLVLAYGLFGFGYVITATFIVAIVRGSAPALENVIWLIVGLAAIPSIRAWSMVAGRSSALQAFAFAAALEAIGVLASVMGSSIAWLIIAAICLGGTFMGLTALGLMAARSLAPGNARRALAGMTAAFGVGQAIGPIVAGYGFDWTGSFVIPSVVAAGALAVAVILALAVDRQSARGV